jgi:hypothetical protein
MTSRERQDVVPAIAECRDVQLDDIVPNAGDGAGVTRDRALSLTAVEETEILVIGLGAERPWSLRAGGLPLDPEGTEPT